MQSSPSRFRASAKSTIDWRVTYSRCCRGNLSANLRSRRESDRKPHSSSGDVLRRPGEPLGPSQIYNSNRFTLLGLLRRLGCDIVDLGLVADTFDATRSHAPHRNLAEHPANPFGPLIPAQV